MQEDIVQNQLPSKAGSSEKCFSVQATEKCDNDSIIIRKQRRECAEESLKLNVRRVKEMASPLRKAKKVTKSKDPPANQIETSMLPHSTLLFERNT